MASFAPIRGKQSEIQTTPLVDGQFLIETDQGNQNKIYIDGYDDSTPPVLQRTMAGGGGHQILPVMDNPSDPNYPPTEDKVVDAVNTVGASPTTDKIASLYGMNKWTNEKTKRLIVKGAAVSSAIGHTGIGTWVEDAEVIEVDSPSGDPSAQDWYEIDETNHVYTQTTDTSVVTDKRYFSTIVDESDWIYSDLLTTIDADDSDDITVNLKFDPKTNEPIILGGYMVDTNTGRACVRFGNYILDTEHAVVALDVTYTRNEYAVVS